MNIEKLIEDNTKLIYKITNFFYNVEKEDLYQAGVVGLLKAYKNYKKNGKCKFSSYAYDYIYGEMYLLANNKTIKINKDILKLYKMIEKTRYTLAQKYNYIPSNVEIAKFLELPLKSIEEAIISGNEIMSLDNEVERPLYETLEFKEKYNVDDKILISEGLKELTNEEKEIIKARYYEDMTQSETAKKLGLTQVMISRYEKRSLQKMNTFIKS